MRRGHQKGFLTLMLRYVNTKSVITLKGGENVFFPSQISGAHPFRLRRAQPVVVFTFIPGG